MPSFARQTGMTCAACHTVFPELTPFGREFKLNGYVLDNIKQVTGIDIDSSQTLSLNQIPPISLMLQISYTHTSAPLPDSAISRRACQGRRFALSATSELLLRRQNRRWAGGFHTADLRRRGRSSSDSTTPTFAMRIIFPLAAPTSNDHELILGVTLNNNPTVQDVWNTTPAWGFPYAASSVAPHGDHLGENRQRRRGLWPNRGRPRRVCVVR